MAKKGAKSRRLSKKGFEWVLIPKQKLTKKDKLFLTFAVGDAKLGEGFDLLKARNKKEKEEARMKFQSTKKKIREIKKRKFW